MSGKRQVPELCYEAPPLPIYQFNVKRIRPSVLALRPAKIVILPHPNIACVHLKISLTDGFAGVKRVQQEAERAGARHIVVQLDMRSVTAATTPQQLHWLKGLTWAITAGADFVLPVFGSGIRPMDLRGVWNIPPAKLIVGVYHSVSEALALHGKLSAGGFWCTSSVLLTALLDTLPPYLLWVNKKALEERRVCFGMEYQAPTFLDVETSGEHSESEYS